MFTSTEEQIGILSVKNGNFIIEVYDVEEQKLLIL